MDQSQLVEHKPLAVALIDENESNPNKMSSREFDLLVDNIQQRGITEAIVVRPVADRFRVVSGHHRLKAAVYLGYEEVPTAIITDPNFDDELELAQLIRMNAIKGQLDPQAFVAAYSKFAGKYGDDLIQDMFGFADDLVFKRLIAQTAKKLPKELKSKFEEAAKEVTTIDGLAKVLNSLFTKYGDTVPYAYMVVDHGGQKHLWLRISKKTWDALQLIGDVCIEQSVTMDSLVGGIVQSIAQGEMNEQVTALVEKAPKVIMPASIMALPTEDHIAQAATLSI